MSDPSIFERRPKATLIVVLAVIFILLLATAEGACRLYRHFWHEPRYDYFMDDQTLGWALNIHLLPRRERNKCGENVEVSPPPGRYLNRRPKDTGKTRVLFIGDSFTHAHTVSKGGAFFDVFDGLNQDKYSVYAAGVGGYGNLQEYLLLKKLYPEINPAIVFWQLSGNDPYNNIYELDRASFINNSQRKRPYLDLASGKIVIKDPRFWLFKYSCLSKTLFGRLAALDGRFHLGLLQAAENFIGLDDKELIRLRQPGLEVLRRVLKRAMSDYPDTLFVGFSVDSSFDQKYQEIFQACGAAYLPGLYRQVAKEPGKTDCAPLDFHWNRLGHQAAGKAIARMLAQGLKSQEKPGETKGH